MAALERHLERLAPLFEGIPTEAKIVAIARMRALMESLETEAKDEARSRLAAWFARNRNKTFYKRQIRVLGFTVVKLTIKGHDIEAVIESIIGDTDLKD